MKNSAKSYDNLSDDEKYQLLHRLYTIEGKSFGAIAKDYDTYANRIRRDAKSLNINIRNKSEAQKNALQTGSHKHPTKGTQRSEQTKQKIGEGMIEAWESLDESVIQERKLKFKQKWEELSEDQKKHMQKLANDAVRAASKAGSKLEKFLLQALLKAGYKVEFHKEQALVNTKLQIDLFLPTMNLAIEVDGPSHFEPVWGQDTLQRNKTYDIKKEGLILGKGLSLVRIKQRKDFSKTRAQMILDNLLECIKDIGNKSSAQKDKIIIIED